MLKALLRTGAATTFFVGANVLFGPAAQAQVGIEIGPGGPRLYDDRPVIERRIIERRGPSRRVVIEEDDDEVCETRTRRVRVNGVWRNRRVTVCE